MWTHAGLVEALTLAVDTARRLSSHAVDAAVAAAQQTDDPSFTGWRAAGLWGGYAGLAVLAASLDTVEPECGWDSVGFDYLRRAVRGMEAEQSPSVGLTGLTGLATSASLLSRDGSRYDTLLTTLETAIVERVEHMSQGVLRSRPHGVPVACSTSSADWPERADICLAGHNLRHADGHSRRYWVH